MENSFTGLQPSVISVFLAEVRPWLDEVPSISRSTLWT